MSVAHFEIALLCVFSFEAAVAVAHRFEFRSANELLGISIKEVRSSVIFQTRCAVSMTDADCSSNSLAQQ